MNKIIKILIVVLIIIVIWFAVRFIIGGPEDDWICVDGQWVKHGAPSAPMPTQPCPGSIDCQSLGIEECTGQCVVCPPCEACSSISCQTESFCKNLGFDKSWYEMVKKQIKNFDDCIKAGNPAMESYPRQCRTEDGRLFTENIGNELEKADLIRIDSPRPNQIISSPLTITGQARGSWFFEADFPVVLTDWDGLIIAEGIAQAQSDWMTEDFVPFTATLEFSYPTYKNNGTLILQKDNPSGLPENDDALEVPILFAQIRQPQPTGDASITQAEALRIARESQECSEAGVLTDNIFYNENSKTWWIDLERMPELEKDGCNPACVVSEQTQTAEVNWRCTGLIPPED